MLKLPPLLMMLLSSLMLISQTNNHPFISSGRGDLTPPTERICLTETQRNIIKKQLQENQTRLQAEGKLKTNSRFIVSFGWPLRKSNALSYNSYFSISNYVDHDPTTGLLSYDCDTHTYDGHQGTDIYTTPFSWYLYDNDFVQVIAGEAGTIISKQDGNDDDHCSFSGNWNAVYIQHVDGSVAWYGHMKRNSLTPKPVGATVAKGEYLGVVASSGYSTGPHLHLEVYDNNNNLIDPYAGNCNSLNGNTSWWASQDPPRVPTLNAVLTHDAVPEMGCPGVNEHPNFQDDFYPGDSIFVASYYRDRPAGNITNHRIRTPNNSIWANWTTTANVLYSSSYYWNKFFLPNNGPFGVWKFETDFNGQTYTHEFNYHSPLPVELVEFTTQLVNETFVELKWSTASELNNYGFEIQHAIDGEHWQTISFVKGHGTSLELNSYSYTHTYPNKGENYYRLKQIDFDGSIDFSDIKTEILKETGAVNLVPNPTKGNLQIFGVAGKAVKIEVYDRIGKRVKTLILSDQYLDISNLSTGLYIVRILADNQIFTKRIIKQ